jgi:hypothetical protein
MVVAKSYPRNHHDRMAWARKAGLNHWRKLLSNEVSAAGAER